jgi:hypothetical protein
MDRSANGTHHDVDGSIAQEYFQTVDSALGFGGQESTLVSPLLPGLPVCS